MTTKKTVSKKKAPAKKSKATAKKTVAKKKAVAKKAPAKKEVVEKKEVPSTVVEQPKVETPVEPQKQEVVETVAERIKRENKEAVEKYITDRIAYLKEHAANSPIVRKRLAVDYLDMALRVYDSNDVSVYKLLLDFYLNHPGSVTSLSSADIATRARGRRAQGVATMLATYGLISRAKLRGKKVQFNRERIQADIQPALLYAFIIKNV